MQILYVPCPDSLFAEKIARTLLEEKRVACANILPAMKSMYWWKGQIEQTTESILLLKTDLSEADYSALERRIRELHPYETPCLLRLEPRSVNGDYMSWIQESLKT